MLGASMEVSTLDSEQDAAQGSTAKAALEAVDTQWPRFEVFILEQPGANFVDVGSVHAPDAEMALLNARDVFARRPQAVGMWVIPTKAIVSLTAEELSARQMPNPQTGSAAGAVERYYVGCKTRHAGSITVIGEIEASSPLAALAAAPEQFFEIQPALVWWVFPVSQVTASRPEDAPGFYEPAHDKTFRLSTDFHTHTAMRRARKG